MSIRNRITARLAAIGDGFDRYFAPWAGNVQRADAHRAEIERIQAEQDESYAQAMARLTGADPATFEPEHEDHTGDYEAAGWPIGMRAAGLTADQAVSLNEHAIREAVDRAAARRRWEQLEPAATREDHEFYRQFDLDEERARAEQDAAEAAQDAAREAGQIAEEAAGDGPEADAWPDNEYAAEDAYEADHHYAAQINAKADELRRAHRLAVYAEKEYGRKSSEAGKADMALNDVTFGASSAALHAYAQMANADAGPDHAEAGDDFMGAPVPEEPGRGEVDTDKYGPYPTREQRAHEAGGWRFGDLDAEELEPGTDPENADQAEINAPDPEPVRDGAVISDDMHAATAAFDAGDISREQYEARCAGYHAELDALFAANRADYQARYPEPETEQGGRGAPAAEDGSGFMGAPVPEADAIEVTRPDGDRFVTRHADLDRARLLYREADGWSCKPVAGQHDAQIEAGQ